jgi:hypothetical protein
VAIAFLAYTFVTECTKAANSKRRQNGRGSDPVRALESQELGKVEMRIPVE